MRGTKCLKLDTEVDFAAGIPNLTRPANSGFHVCVAALDLILLCPVNSGFHVWLH